MKRRDWYDGMYCYRLYDVVGQLLYVGLTSYLEQRRRGHQSTKSWWPHVFTWRIVGPFQIDRGLAYERRTIWNERPLHNRCVRPTKAAAA